MAGWAQYYDWKKRITSLLKELHSYGWALPEYKPDTSKLQFDIYEPEDVGNWTVWSPDPSEPREEVVYYIVLAGSGHIIDNQKKNYMMVRDCDKLHTEYNYDMGVVNNCKKYVMPDKYRYEDMVKLTELPTKINYVDALKVTNRTAWVLIKAEGQPNGEFKYTPMEKGGRYEAKKILQVVQNDLYRIGKFAKSTPKTVSPKKKGDVIEEYKIPVEDVAFKELSPLVRYVPPPLLAINELFSNTYFEHIPIVFVVRESLRKEKGERGKVTIFIGAAYGSPNFIDYTKNRYLAWVCNSRRRRLHFFRVLKDGEFVWFEPRRTPPMKHGKPQYPVYNYVDLEMTERCDVCKGEHIDTMSSDIHICIPYEMVIGGTTLNGKKSETYELARIIQTYKQASFDKKFAYTFIFTLYVEKGKKNQKMIEDDMISIKTEMTRNSPLFQNLAKMFEGWVRAVMKEEYL